MMKKSKACPMGSKKAQEKHEATEKKLIKKEKRVVNKLEKMHKMKKDRWTTR